VDGLVSALHRELVDRRVACFFDAESLKPGVRWKDIIRKWVVNSKVVVVILSPSYPKRMWPLEEMSLAVQPTQGRVIVPVLFGVTREDFSPASSTRTRQEWQTFWRGLSDTALPPGVQPGELLRSLEDHQMLDLNGIVFCPHKGAFTRAARDIYARLQRHLRA
jgi:hypothetical protein